jgi:hypothetical protein
LRSLPPEGQGRSTKNRQLLAKAAGVRYCFSESSDSSARLVIGAGGDLGGGAKRNGVEVVENKQFREILHFAPPMISRAYARVAKPFVSLGE